MESKEGSGSSDGIVNMLRVETNEPKFDSRQVQENLPFFKASRPTLGFTQNPIQRGPGALFPGPGREAHFRLVSR